MWSEILSAALIGTERQEFKLSPNTSSERLNNLLSQLNSTDQEYNLLSAAGILTFYKEAGKVANKRAKEAPKACELDDLPCCSLVISKYLPSLLNNNFQRFLSEFLEELALVNKRIPTESLPQLLNFGAMNQHYQEAICKVIGKRGYWLAAQNTQNPNWDYAKLEDTTGKTAEEIWQTANEATRIHLLRNLRRENPTNAIKLLATTWDKEELSTRFAFIKILEIGLTIDDEPFLELALGDSRKEIRSAAQVLLSKLSQSQLHNRVFEQARVFIKKVETKKKTTLEAKIPDEFNDLFLRDLAESKSPTTPQDKTKLLQKIISIIDPDYWAKEWNFSIVEVLELIEKSAQSETMFYALSEAIVNHSKLEWAEQVILKYLPAEKNKAAILQFISKAFSILPIDKKEKLLISFLSNKKLFGGSEITLLTQYNRVWSKDLSRKLIGRVIEFIDGDKQNNWFLNYLKTFVFFLPTTMLEEISQALDPDKWPSWSKELEEFLSILQFRYDVLKEIHL